MKYKGFIILGIVIAILVTFVAIYLPGYSRNQKLKTKAETLQADIDRIAAENSQLEAELKRLQTDLSYLEQVLRNEMGLVKPGETLYKIIEKPVEPQPEYIEAETQAEPQVE